MARIRSVKPELRTSIVVAEWPREVRYAWVLLWGYLDDYGRGLDDLRLIVADLFPLDRDVTERKMDKWLATMAGPLCRYTVGGRRYLHAVNWKDHQRVSHPKDSRWPACPDHEEGQKDSGEIPEPLPKPSGVPHEDFATSRTPAEQGAGSREQGAGSSADAGGSPPPLRAVPPPDTAATVVAAYADAVKAAGGLQDPRAKGRIGKDAGALIASGAPVHLLVDAAQRLATNGYADLGTEARRLWSERNATRSDDKNPHTEWARSTR
jgi:hypothetical protein